VALKRNGNTVDALETKFNRMPAAWRSPRTVVLALPSAQAALQLPPDARNVRLTLASSSAAQFSRIVDDLLEYPYGCVEQTASRMIPYALAIQSLGPDRQAVADRLRQQLNGHRLRLAYMAGPNATFYWWGPDTAEDPMLTPYAYFADWTAARILGIELPQEHWNRLLDVYSKGGHALPLAQRALVLNWMQDMGLPVKNLSEGLFADLEKSGLDFKAAQIARVSQATSPLLGVPNGPLARAMALALADRLARQQKMTLPAALAKQLDGAYGVLRASGQPAAESLMMANGRLPASEAERVLGAVRAEMPTMERAMTLIWVDRALGGQRGDGGAAIKVDGQWQRTVSGSGAVVWRWPADKPLPTEIKLAQPPAKPLAAIVQYDTAAPETHQLQATIVRRLYRVTKNPEQGYLLEPLADNAKVSTSELYLDEVSISTTGPVLRYTLLEAPLPPGGSIESTTWGITLPSPRGEFVPLERTRHEPTPYGYAVPIEPLTGSVTVRHLVRFAQKGSYVLPAARLYRMYQPDLKAFEGKGATRTLEVK
jgi:uncharacterized protein YfaS (alpha-2-macroglobulin family)